MFVTFVDSTCCASKFFTPEVLNFSKVCEDTSLLHCLRKRKGCLRQHIVSLLLRIRNCCQIYQGYSQPPHQNQGACLYYFKSKVTMDKLSNLGYQKTSSSRHNFHHLFLSPILRFFYSVLYTLWWGDQTDEVNILSLDIVVGVLKNCFSEIKIHVLHFHCNKNNNVARVK